MGNLTKEQYSSMEVMWAQLSQWAEKEKGTKLTMKIFYNTYLYLDVFLLLSLLKELSKSYFEYFEIDLLHYITVPSYAWSIFRRKCKVPLELLENPLLHDVFTYGCHGGNTFLTEKVICSNEPSIPDFRPNMHVQEHSFLDKTSLYPSSSYQTYLGHKSFREWLKTEVISYFENMKKNAIWEQWNSKYAILRKDQNGQDEYIGLTLVCDLEIKDAHHSYWDSFPPINSRC